MAIQVRVCVKCLRLVQSPPPQNSDTPPHTIHAQPHPTKFNAAFVRWERSIENLSSAVELDDNGDGSFRASISFAAETGESLKTLLAPSRGCYPVERLRAYVRKKKESSWKSLTWRRRFLVLTDSCLTYYKAIDSSTAQGILPLACAMLVTLVPGHTDRFRVRTATSKHIFAADDDGSSPTAAEWVTRINTHILFLQASKANAYTLRFAGADARKLLLQTLNVFVDSARMTRQHKADVAAAELRSRATIAAVPAGAGAGAGAGIGAATTASAAAAIPAATATVAGGAANASVTTAAEEAQRRWHYIDDSDEQQVCIVWLLVLAVPSVLVTNTLRCQTRGRSRRK